jgi:hypothetical protein
MGALARPSLLGISKAFSPRPQRGLNFCFSLSGGYLGCVIAHIATKEAPNAIRNAKMDKQSITYAET